jgi:hypothetical protein
MAQANTTFNISNFVENCNSLDIIDNKIIFFHNLLDGVHKMKLSIEKTSNLKSIEEIKEIITEVNHRDKISEEINILRKDLQLLQNELHSSTTQLQRVQIQANWMIIDEKLNQKNMEYQKLSNDNRNELHKLMSIYNEIFNKSFIFGYSSCDLCLLELINYNINTQIEINKLLFEYNNIETIKNILIELYKKRIHLIQLNL